MPFKVAVMLMLPFGIVVYDATFGDLGILGQESRFGGEAGWACSRCLWVNEPSLVRCMRCSRLPANVKDEAA